MALYFQVIYRSDEEYFIFFNISTENAHSFTELLLKLPAECMQTKLEMFINLIACESS